MMEWIKALLYGIIEGITEWLPISSTGHMILFEEFVKLDMSDGFYSFFLVAIQLGAVLAAALYFAKFILGQTLKENGVLLLKIVISCIPAGVIGILIDDWIDAHFYNYIVVSIMLIVFGVVFLLVDKNEKTEGKRLAEISYTDALYIGFFQLLSAVFPGTSRSGATIIGGLLRGLSRKTAAEYTFIMSIPVMFGASFIKLLKLEAAPTAQEAGLLAVGAISAFVLSIFCINGLLKYIKTKSFKVFGYYRIALGLVVFGYMFFIR